MPKITKNISDHSKDSSPKGIEESVFEKSMIHRTLRGEMVRSKSEVIIADRLFKLDVEYKYEYPFIILGLTICPDFTIEDIKSGRNFYWEHNKFSHIAEFDKLWNRRMDNYRAAGILPHEDGGGENGALIVTSDSPEKRIPSQEIERIIREVILK